MENVGEEWHKNIEEKWLVNFSQEPKSDLLIGISLARGVEDIVLGRIAPKDIMVINTETACKTKDEWLKLVKNYAGRHWNNIGTEDEWASNQNKAIEVATKLWDDGKIRQPRLFAEACPRLDGSHWRSDTGASKKLPDKPVERPAETTLDTSAAANNIPAKQKV